MADGYVGLFRVPALGLGKAPDPSNVNLVESQDKVQITFDPTGNMVKNGYDWNDSNADGTADDWQISTTYDDEATLTIDDGQKVTATSSIDPSSGFWHIRLFQLNIPFVVGETYKITIDSKISWGNYKRFRIRWLGNLPEEIYVDSGSSFIKASTTFVYDPSNATNDPDGGYTAAPSDYHKVFIEPAVYDGVEGNPGSMVAPVEGDNYTIRSVKLEKYSTELNEPDGFEIYSYYDGDSPDLIAQIDTPYVEHVPNGDLRDNDDKWLQHGPASTSMRVINSFGNIPALEMNCGSGEESAVFMHNDNCVTFKEDKTYRIRYEYYIGENNDSIDTLWSWFSGNEPLERGTEIGAWTKVDLIHKSNTIETDTTKLRFYACIGGDTSPDMSGSAGNDIVRIRNISVVGMQDDLVVIDDTYDRRATLNYDLYSLCKGNRSYLSTSSINLTYSVPSPSNIYVSAHTTGFIIDWIPLINERMLDNYKLYYRAQATDTGWPSSPPTDYTLIYSGKGTSYTHEEQVGEAGYYHKFYIESTTNT